MVKLVKKFEKKKVKKSIHVQLENGFRNILIKDILYIEEFGHYPIFHLQNEELKSSKRISLAKIEKDLMPNGFKRCNSSFLINLSKVEAFTKESVIVNNIEFKVSRGMKKELFNILSKEEKCTH